MQRIRIVLPLILLLSVVFGAGIAINGASALARSHAQATNTPPAATPAPASQDQTYVTLLPSAAGATRLLVITLQSDGKVNLVNDPLGPDPGSTQVGTWQHAGDTVTVTITGDGKVDLTHAVIVKFKHDGENLVATEFDKSIFGDKPFTLYLRDAVEAKLAALHRAYVSVDLAAGFPLDPFFVSVNGGGELDANILGDKCHGYINGNPTVSVNWTGKADLVRAFTYSDADPTLVVQTPDGKFLCGDDQDALALDSQIEIPNPSQGAYNIWVGSAAPKQLLPTVLVLTARPDVNLNTFDLGTLVKRPPLPPEAPRALQAKIVTEAIARYKGAVGGPLGATPLKQQVTSAGEIAAFDIEIVGAQCNGFISDTPDYVFDVSSAVDQIAVLFEGKQDAALLVAGPNGFVACNDDSATGSNTNPLVKIEKPKQGRYAVFVGRLNKDAPVEGTLVVTTDPNATPQALPPAK